MRLAKHDNHLMVDGYKIPFSSLSCAYNPLFTGTIAAVALPHKIGGWFSDSFLCDYPHPSIHPHVSYSLHPSTGKRCLNSHSDQPAGHTTDMNCSCLPLARFIHRLPLSMKLVENQQYELNNPHA